MAGSIGIRRLGTTVIGLLAVVLAEIGPASGMARAQGPEPHPIAYGETVSGTLDDAHYEERWAFDGQRGDLIRVAMARTADVPGGLDGYLLLIGPDGTVLAEVDDTGDSVMPTLQAYALPADGPYTLVATRFGFANGFSGGNYTLTVERIGRQAPAGAVAEMGARWLPSGTLPPGLRWLVYNQPVGGRLDGDHLEDWYIFHGRAGDVITLRLSAAGSTLDPFLIVTDGAGYELARADDSDGSPDAVISDLSLPADGSYLVRATRYGFAHGPSTGTYTLAIETDAVPSGPGTTSPHPLTPGVPVSGTLDLETPVQRYAFRAQAGQQATVTAARTAGMLDPVLVLRGPEGTPLATGHPWIAAGETQILSISLPADGLYTLDVTLSDLSTAGTYRLIAILAPPAEPITRAFVPTAGLDVEAVLIWASPADLDLTVTDVQDVPGERDAQANDFCARGQAGPVERVTWAEGAATPGLYTVIIQYRFDCAGTGAPVPFMLGLAVRGAVFDVIGGTLARPGDAYTTHLIVD